MESPWVSILERKNITWTIWVPTMTIMTLKKPPSVNLTSQTCIAFAMVESPLLDLQEGHKKDKKPAEIPSVLPRFHSLAGLCDSSGGEGLFGILGQGWRLEGTKITTKYCYDYICRMFFFFVSPCFRVFFLRFIEPHCCLRSGFRRSDGREMTGGSWFLGWLEIPDLLRRYRFQWFPIWPILTPIMPPMLYHDV